ncbi:Speckle-type POZ protein [Araneus ventricosus]|uniref:Speckle-type POZ protein n=1 Tax=Araneus ventricosus TaxID=182803 RepID=A0A4Y2Q7U2_ARAVE|nr:Speckle-type POZ protein [Araneus ventricosus]
MNNGRSEYVFFWFIENYSYCWHKNGEELDSPNFTIDELQGTIWNLQLHPRGMRDEDEGHISLFLYRSKQDDGPEDVSIKYELSFIAADGSTFCCEKTEYEFKRGDGCGCGKFLKMDKILLRRNSDYLPEDILTVRCKIWKGEGNIQNIGQSSARSRIRVEKNSFLHVVENFSTLQSDAKQTIKIHSHSKKGCFISSSLYFTEGLCCKEKIMIEIVPSNTNQILCKCEFSLLDRSGNVIECGVTDNRYDVARKSIRKLPLSLTREAVLYRKNEYLLDDKLSLICKCTFSSGIEFETIEETLNKVPLDVMKRKRNYVPGKNAYEAAKKLCTNSSVLEDIKSLYINQYLTDVEVKMETKSFQAHKIVLCARSPVFKAMFTNDMKEKNIDCIRVDDLEDDIMQQLLFFLYSDNIENLQWESATQLYYAADKYQIGKLKEVCSSFLVESLTTTNAGELLLLADTHNDNNLKKSVEGFILEHEEEIFVSKEWDMVVKKNPLLVIKTMQSKYQRKN